VPCVAMVTASHNDNGWPGVKMGANRPLTFGADEMSRLPFGNVAYLGLPFVLLTSSSILALLARDSAGVGSA